jgi:uncharacterized protein YggE
MQYHMNSYENDECGKCNGRIMKLNGEGMVEAEPDMVQISIGIVTKDKNPQAAQNSNEAISQKVIAALLQLGLPKSDIKTTAYTISAEYDYIEGKQILSGYTATQILEVRVRDITLAGQVIHTAVENGANQINRVEFTLQDSQYYYNKALKLAVRDAATKAQSIAAAMKVALDTIPCNIIERSTSFTPILEQDTLKLAAIPSLMPGSIQVIASVAAEFQYMV